MSSAGNTTRPARGRGRSTRSGELKSVSSIMSICATAVWTKDIAQVPTLFALSNLLPEAPETAPALRKRERILGLTRGFQCQTQLIKPPLMPSVVRPIALGAAGGRRPGAPELGHGKF